MQKVTSQTQQFSESLRASNEQEECARARLVFFKFLNPITVTKQPIVLFVANFHDLKKNACCCRDFSKVQSLGQSLKLLYPPHPIHPFQKRRKVKPEIRTYMLSII